MLKCGKLNISVFIKSNLTIVNKKLKLINEKDSLYYNYFTIHCKL